MPGWIGFRFRVYERGRDEREHMESDFVWGWDSVVIVSKERRSFTPNPSL